MNAASPHAPVLLDEMVRALSPQSGEIMVDGTFGAGGYSEALLEAADCRVVGIDRDPSVRPHVERLQARFKERFSFKEGRFGEAEALLEGRKIDGLVLDIGVSSMQLDTPERGFSFRFDAPLDMRMSPQGKSAADLLAGASEKELSDLLWRYGEEKASRRIAAAIVKLRAEMPITTTAQLCDLIYRVIPPRGQKTHPATRTFQALRIAVNQELEDLERVLAASLIMLRTGGRLVVVTFHSLEDRIVKKFMRAHATAPVAPSRHVPDFPGDSRGMPPFKLLYTKGVSATEAEIRRNPRARSATLRACVRTDAPYKEAA